MTRRTTLTGAILLALALALLLAGVSGCTSPPKRAVVVLLDETTSWSEDYWDTVVGLIAQKVVMRMRQGETFCLIGIDSRGFEAADVRIGYTVLPDSLLPAQGKKKELAAAVRSLTPRPGDKGTDILGALKHAAYFLDRAVNNPAVAHGGQVEPGQQAGAGQERSDMQPVLLVFSDMVPDLRHPGEPAEVGQELAKWRMPLNTSVQFLYVKERGAEEWRELVESWAAAFQEAGLSSVDDYNFQVPQGSQGAIDSLFPQ